jgi:uncharacterized protein
MPKRFIYFLAVAQVILVLFHWLIFSLLITFFPSLLAHHLGLLITILILSISFFAASTLDYKFDGPILKILYILSSVWLVFAFYFAMASVVVLVASTFGIMASLAVAGWIAVSAAFTLALYGLINARVTRVMNIKVTLPNMPEIWKGRTAVMASDLHLGHVLHFGFVRKIIKLINEQKPNIVFLPGDFYDGVHTNFAELADEFKKVNSPLGIYFSSGNHEMFAGYEKCEAAIKGAGIKILEDSMLEIDGLQLAGVAYKDESDETVAERIKKINLNKQKPSILLKHVPNHLKPISEAGISLQLSGHSHHGQIWPFRYVTKKVFKGFDYGLKKFGPMFVYTSSGAGTWGPPLRVFTKSEIVKITFE